MALSPGLRDTQVSQHQKKHSPTHHPDHHLYATNGPKWSRIQTVYIRHKHTQWLLDVERNMYAIFSCLLIEYTNVIVHI